MLEQVVGGVWVLQSALLENNAVVIGGLDGALLVDPGQTRAELRELASGIRGLGTTVAAGFATHSHWDHVLWHPELGSAPRYGTERCAAQLKSLLAMPDWRDEVAEGIPPEIADEVPVDELFGRIIGLPEGSEVVPWSGTDVRIVEHIGHEAGHAALVVEEQRVLIAGDMLSDVLIPMLSWSAQDPIGDYLAALQLFDDLADRVDVVIPGHGSVGTNVRARIELDREYLRAILEGREPDDPRIGAHAKPGWEWVRDVHAGQLERLRG